MKLDLTLPILSDDSSLLSVSGKIWELASPDQRISQALTQRYNLPSVVSDILTGRNIGLDGAAHFLDPRLKELLPDPSNLRDMDKAVDRVYSALHKGEKIAIFGDYDVDGATASALLKRYLQSIGSDAEIYIPNRISEGYGPNAAALESLYEGGARVVLMVDCGTTAFSPLERAKAIGLDVIVIDHLVPEPSLPPTTALINPNRLDELLPNLTGLCAAGLAFIFVVGLNRRLRQEGWFETRAEPDIRQFLDIVALGTVCDVMPLTGLNRAYVLQGLRILSHRSNPGLAALADIAGVNEAMSAYHLGFVLGPRINAGGRVGEAGLGAQLLSSDDSKDAKSIAQKLNTYNQERQIIEQHVLDQALAQIDTLQLKDKPLIMVSGDGWHPGVIGIVAGRVKERFNRPACVVGFDGELGKGSGRSITGIDLGTAMHQATTEGYLVFGGGHAMAAGFTVIKTQYEAFYNFLCQNFHSSLSSFTPRLKIDAGLHIGGITPDLVNHLKCLEPFGNGNPQPRFLLKNISIPFSEAFSQGHCRATLHGEDGSRIRAVSFRSIGSPLGDALLERPQRADAVVTLKDDVWNGVREIKVFIEDLRVY